VAAERADTPPAAVVPAVVVPAIVVPTVVVPVVVVPADTVSAVVVPAVVGSLSFAVLQTFFRTLSKTQRCPDIDFRN